MADPTTTSQPAAEHSSRDGAELQARIIRTGEDLLAGLSNAVGTLSASRSGPQAFARQIGIDKVLASRVLKTIRSEDPLAAIHRSPGPEPLKRLIKAMAKAGADPSALEAAGLAVERFESLIRDDVGDRGSLDAIVSVWVPEARKEFELRRKQSLYKALSHLKGAQAETSMATVFLYPSATDPDRVDVVWITGVFGLHRLRPDVSVRFATRSVGGATDGREPMTLDGAPIGSSANLILREFCSDPAPSLDVSQTETAVQYLLDGNSFGPRSAVDIVFGEVNRADIPRFAGKDPNRKGFVFAEVTVSCKAMQFDALIHQDLLGATDPSLRLYDTSFEGVADPNDPGRDIDRLDLLETIEPLGAGIDRCRSTVVRRYSAMLEHVCSKMGWDADAFRAFRTTIDYPLYGSQVAMTFDRPAKR